MCDSDKSVLESWKIQLEKIGLCDMIKDLPDIFKLNSYKFLLLRKLLLVITSDCELENKTDEEVLDSARDYGFCIPEDFLKLTDISQNQVIFWNRILKCINYLDNEEKIKNKVPYTQNSTENNSSYKLEEIANILEKSTEESSLGCVELDSDKNNVDGSLSNCELEVAGLIQEANEALNYLTPLSKHTRSFVDNMQDLSYHTESHCTDCESGPPSTKNDPTLFKRIDLLHHQVKEFDKILDSFNKNLQVSETLNM